MVDVKCLIPSISRYAMYVAFDSYFSLCVVVCVCVCVCLEPSIFLESEWKQKENTTFSQQLFASLVHSIDDYFRHISDPLLSSSM